MGEVPEIKSGENAVPAAQPVEAEEPKSGTKRTRRLKRFRFRMKRPRIVRINILPSLITLGNLVCGVAAIFFVINAESLYAEGGNLSHLAYAAWLILAGMIFDVFDGQVARLTKTASEFGGELDSLSDAITFGVAPAALIYKVVPMIHIDIAWGFAAGTTGGRVLWAVCVFYPICAILRLARFNVGNDTSAESHSSFTGLPSPAAAGVIATLVLLFFDYENGFIIHKVVAESDYLNVVAILFPTVTFLVAVLMVSRVRYVHFASWLVSGKRHPSHLVLLIFIVLLVVIAPHQMLATFFCGFAMLGPFLFLRGFALRLGRGKVAPSTIELSLTGGAATSGHDKDESRQENAVQERDTDETFF
ncbi:MAG: CDP-diacylglycerol--serine O-phosphatidyltransferase [Planctomycetes bacterium]|nr:CDP-diacylglycerol--serine O-phosphatidyltransferase [Planctomycetota bacterium]